MISSRRVDARRKIFAPLAIGLVTLAARRRAELHWRADMGSSWFAVWSRDFVSQSLQSEYALCSFSGVGNFPPPCRVSGVRGECHSCALRSEPDIWLSPLMILVTQGTFFSIHAGASGIPDLTFARPPGIFHLGALGCGGYKVSSCPHFPPILSGSHHLQPADHGMAPFVA